MKQRFYLFSDSLIKRKNNTLCIFSILKDDENEEENCEILNELKEEYLTSGNKTDIYTGKKYIPVENIESFFAFGSINFNSRLIYFLSKYGIPIHLFNFRGSYAGSFFPPQSCISGSILLKQTDYYKDYKKRIYIASQFVSASANNAQANLKYYNNRGKCLEEYINEIEILKEEIKTCSTVNELMGIEGIIKKTYYESWKHIFNYPVAFYRRIKNPPSDMINSLISYGNMIVYGVCINEIYMTRLYPEIGFLHEPSDNKLSLCYDIADIFKPIFTDRIIFKVINNNIITEKDFFVKNGFCRIKKEARKKFALEFEEKLKTKISYPGSSKRYSYKSIVRNECYKLIKHISNEEKYTAYKTKW